MSQSCNDGYEMQKKSVIRVQSSCFANLNLSASFLPFSLLSPSSFLSALLLSSRNSPLYTALFSKNIQLFRKRLSEKVHATILKGTVGGFEITVLHRNFERMAREAMDVCFRVLKRSSKSRFDSYSVRNSVQSTPS